jgi:hypothetical protein
MCIQIRNMGENENFSENFRENENFSRKFFRKLKFFTKDFAKTATFRTGNIQETKLLRESFRKNENFRENFRESKHFRKTKFREKWANFRLFSLLAKSKKGFSFQSYSGSGGIFFVKIYNKNLKLKHMDLYYHCNTHLHLKS